MDRLLALEHPCEQRRRIRFVENLGTVDPVDDDRRLPVPERVLALEPRDPFLARACRRLGAHEVGPLPDRAAGLLRQVPDDRRTHVTRPLRHVRQDMRVTRVAIVGAGVMGCAAAWALAARGADVTLYEQFELDHERGSSHGRTRIVRLSYPDASWVRLARESMDA